MMQHLRSIFNLYLQAFIAVLLIGSILVLMIQQIITSDEGLPILTLIGGFIVGQSTKRNSKS